MLRRMSVPSALALALASALVQGCGQGVERPTTVPVSGTVLLNGQPVDGAQVAFTSQDGGARVATGVTDQAGNFQLTTFDTNDGAIPGNHVVTISKASAKDEFADMSAESPNESYGAAMQAAAEGKTEVYSQHQLPVQYADPGSSGLTRTVTEEGLNEFKFEL